MILMNLRELDISPIKFDAQFHLIELKWFFD
jgi:hypothetical protein